MEYAIGIAAATAVVVAKDAALKAANDKHAADVANAQKTEAERVARSMSKTISGDGSTKTIK